jgi:hypothetical protein
MEITPSENKNKTKESFTSCTSCISPKTRKKLPLCFNLLSYLIEFLDLKELIQFAYINRYNGIFLKRYKEKMENCDIVEDYYFGLDKNDLLLFNLLFHSRDSFRNLKILTLSNIMAKSISTTKTFNFVFPNLKEFKLISCRSESGLGIFGEILDGIFKCEKLENIEIKSSRFSTAEIFKIKQNLNNKSGIKNLIIDDCITKLISFSILNPFMKFPDLQTLDLSNNRIRQFGNDILENLQNFIVLKELKLRHCELDIDQDTIDEIISNHTENLKVVDISKNMCYPDLIQLREFIKNFNSTNIGQLKIIFDNSFGY